MVQPIGEGASCRRDGRRAVRRGGGGPYPHLHPITRTAKYPLPHGHIAREGPRREADNASRAVLRQIGWINLGFDRDCIRALDRRVHLGLGATGTPNGASTRSSPAPDSHVTSFTSAMV